MAGRIGIAADRALFYVKGGGAGFRNTASITNLTTGASVSASNNNSGWLLGGGLECAFASNWSAKVEFDYLGLRDFSWNSVLIAGDTFTASRNIVMLKAGINFRIRRVRTTRNDEVLARRMTPDDLSLGGNPGAERLGLLPQRPSHAGPTHRRALAGHTAGRRFEVKTLVRIKK